MKVAVVGAGSTYTPELVSGLGSFDIPIDQLALMDVDDERLDVVGGLATRMLDRAGWRGDLSLTTDLDRAVEGADFVLAQIRVGGQAARLRDETIPLACGCIGQETTGAGGFAKAMRTVPVMLQIADRVRERAGEHAWIVDFTNPVGIVTRSLLDQGIAPSASATSRSGSSAVSRSCSASSRSASSWTRWASTTSRGFGACFSTAATSSRSSSKHTPTSSRSTPGCNEACSTTSAFCRRTTSTTSTTTTACSKSCTSSDAESDGGRRDRARLLEMYRDPTSTTKPALLEQRGGAFYSEAAVGLVASLLRDDGVVHVVDMRNNGVVAGLADDDVVEVPARVRGGIVEPLPQPARARAPRARQHVAAYERLAPRPPSHATGDGAQGAARAPAHRPDRADRRAPRRALLAEVPR